MSRDLRGILEVKEARMEELNNLHQERFLLDPSLQLWNLENSKGSMYPFHTIRRHNMENSNQTHDMLSLREEFRAKMDSKSQTEYQTASQEHNGVLSETNSNPDIKSQSPKKNQVHLENQRNRFHFQNESQAEEESQTNLESQADNEFQPQNKSQTYIESQADNGCQPQINSQHEEESQTYIESQADNEFQLQTKSQRDSESQESQEIDGLRTEKKSQLDKKSQENKEFQSTHKSQQENGFQIQNGVHSQNKSKPYNCFQKQNAEELLHNDQGFVHNEKDISQFNEKDISQLNEKDKSQLNEKDLKPNVENVLHLGKYNSTVEVNGLSSELNTGLELKSEPGDTTR